jgi:hypothetical protein
LSFEAGGAQRRRLRNVCKIVPPTRTAASRLRTPGKANACHGGGAGPSLTACPTAPTTANPNRTTATTMSANAGATSRRTARVSHATARLPLRPRRQTVQSLTAVSACLGSEKPTRRTICRPERGEPRRAARPSQRPPR